MAELNKKIIFTVTNDLTYDQRMQKIGRSLCHAGYVVELVGRALKTSCELSTEPYKQTRLNCIFNKGKLFYIEYNIRLFFYLLYQKMDGICAVDLDTIAPVYFAGKLKSAKLIYDAHEYFTEVPEVVNRPLVKKVWQWVEKTFVPKFELIYTVSPTLAKLFAEKYYKEVGVIMNAPVLVNYVSHTYSEQKLPVLVYQGALNEGRGLENLIAAMQHINGCLLIAGEGDLSDELRGLSKQLNLENKITFLGYVKPAYLTKITSEATIGINLLENKGLSYYYSLSNKFFDYIQARVPQVCIGFPEYQTLNEKYGVAVLVKDCSVTEITSAINELIYNKTLYEELQEKCDFCSLILNWQQEEKKLVAYYHELFR